MLRQTAVQGREAFLAPLGCHDQGIGDIRQVGAALSPALNGSANS